MLIALRSMTTVNDIHSQLNLNKRWTFQLPR
jgi:hypothetical protein